MSKVNPMKCIGIVFSSDPNVKCLHLAIDPTNEIVAAMDPNKAQASHTASKLETEFKELKRQWERCYVINFASSGNNESGSFVLAVL
jgi:hypothetical protein